MNAFLAFLLVSLAGFALLCAGVWLLAGTGWALISGASSLFCIAGFIRRGMTNG
ncbi:hypothetical protein [Phytopseudomonas punonensis]|uniref:Uncharacterized protein n=1 Tax=Phytopseudomonas punonensis TaxID=1220495 RepID=A0A1M7LIV6_9GAMM|nr:hypothetical protein [Pseudomonas punonensis]SHM77433.1 hypothetical protein SAMN05216288_4262 [Pseudomonas punonensis]